MQPRRPTAPSAERGTSLVELLVALIVISTGILALARLFPSGSQVEARDKLTSNAGYYAQQKVEDLSPVEYGDASLTVGRHPPSTDENLGTSGKWKRHYDVETMAAPLDNIKRVIVTVSWTYYGTHSVIDTMYKRR